MEGLEAKNRDPERAEIQTKSDYFFHGKNYDDAMTCPYDCTPRYPSSAFQMITNPQNNRI